MLSEEQRACVEVVLVSPRNPLNVGAAARAMANFGFNRLTVVAPFEAHWREARSAVGAPHVLQGAEERATLAEAVSGCTLILGTGTPAHRKPDQPIVSLPFLAPRITEEVTRGGRAALVFGSEKHGLTRDDFALCHLLVEIPTEPAQPSMNLGQAVAVCLYELSRATPQAAAAGPEPDEKPATAGDLDRLAGVVGETMNASGYSPQIMQDANRHDLQIILRRLDWNEADVKRALGVFRRILWKLKHPSR